MVGLTGLGVDVIVVVGGARNDDVIDNRVQLVRRIGLAIVLIVDDVSGLVVGLTQQSRVVLAQCELVAGYQLTRADVTAETVDVKDV